MINWNIPVVFKVTDRVCYDWGMTPLNAFIIALPMLVLSEYTRKSGPYDYGDFLAAVIVAAGFALIVKAIRLWQAWNRKSSPHSQTSESQD